MRRPLSLAALVLAVLAVPALAMIFTRQVAWGAEDFLSAGVLLGGGAVLVELAMRRLKRPLPRLAAVGAVGAGVMLVWAQAAVGVF